MAYEGPNTKLGFFISSTAFGTTDQYSLVKFSSSGTIGTDIRISDTQGEICHGILDDLGSESSGSACGVVIAGITKAIAGSTHGAITVGTVLYSGGAGNVHTATSSGYYPVGYALEALAADTSSIISINLMPSLNQRTT